MRTIEVDGTATRRAAALAAALGLCAGAVWAAPLDDARRTESQTVQEGAASQKRIDAIDDDRGELFRDYKSTLNQLDKFKRYNKQMREVIADQEKRKSDLREAITRVGDIDQDVVPMARQMLDGLKTFINEDIPFQSKNRTDRIAELETLMSDSRITNAEKYRRVLEAYQIEADFGRAIEAYEERGEGDDAPLLSYVMIGRVALFRQTPDLQTTQMWDNEKRQWINLPSRYADAVRTARDMAKGNVPPDFMVLPVLLPSQPAE